MARVSYASRLLDLVPPWLSRETGTRVLGGVADVLDAHAGRLVEAVQLRFPRALEPTSLPYIGRDRRIRRGPAEPASSYARRLLRWWDDHRIRGNPHALLGQMHAYLLDAVPGAIDVIYQSGTRYRCDVDGAITKDAVAGWEGDGQGPGPLVSLAAGALAGATELELASVAGWPATGRYDVEIREGTSLEVVKVIATATGPARLVLEEPLAGPYTTAATVRQRLRYWARMTVVVRAESALAALPLLTEGGEELLSEGGEELLADVPLPDVDPETWATIPRDWSAAHVQRTAVAVLYGAGELWDYPGPSDEDDWTWGAWEDPSKTIDEDAPIVVTIEEG